MPEPKFARGLIEWMVAVSGFFSPVHLYVSFLMHSPSMTKRDAAILKLLGVVLSVILIFAFCLMEFTDQKVVPAQLM